MCVVVDPDVAPGFYISRFQRENPPATTGGTDKIAFKIAFTLDLHLPLRIEAFRSDNTFRESLK